MSGTEGKMVGPKEVEVAPDETMDSSQVDVSEPASSSGSQELSLDIAVGKSGLLDQIQKLRAEQQTLKEQKKKLATEMKKASRKKKRLQSRACQLTDVDLVEVLRMRKARKGGDTPERTGQA